MTVEEIERRYRELKAKLDAGEITSEQFKSEIEQQRYQDAQQRWWMIGAQSGKWYMFDGIRWIPGQPPVEVSTPPPSVSEPGPAIPSVLERDRAPAQAAPVPPAVQITQPESP